MNGLLLCPDSIPNFLGLFDLSIAPTLLFYSYIPIVILSLFLGFYVLKSDKGSERSRVLLAMIVFFSLWVVGNIVQWIGVQADVVEFAWRLNAVFEVPIYVFAMYFFYLFTGSKEWTGSKKILFAVPFIMTVIFVPTAFNIESFDLELCEGIPGALWNYIYVFEAFITIWIAGISIIRFASIKDWARRIQALLIGIGTSLFLGIFLVSNYLGDFTRVYDINLIGPIGFALFIISVTYIVTKFKTFSVKVVGAQVFVIALVALVVSLLFIDDLTILHMFIALTSVALILIGAFFVRGVKREIEARNKIEKLAGDLKKANTRLLDLDKQKSEFVSFATHQLRAPLTAMKGYTSLILEGEMGDTTSQVREAVGRIYDSSKTLTNIVDDYLNISRIELGTMKYSFEVLNLKDLVESVIGELKPNIDRSGLAFAFSQTPADPKERFMVHADKDKLKQVVANMIDNSVKYTPKGSLEIGLLKSASDRKIVFSVKDTGVGIAPAVMPKLFQKFVRAENANKQNIYGTGLGLFVAKEIVTSHKGRIWAESDGEGKGSTFYLELEMAV